jgi:hypothetical protein
MGTTKVVSKGHMMHVLGGHCNEVDTCPHETDVDGCSVAESELGLR